MKRNTPGVGSASIILMFAVLCLTIFALISLVSANSSLVMAERSANMVKSYYEADALAERILSDYLESEPVPEYISFACPVSEGKELYVEATVVDGYCDVKTWHLRDTDEWETDRNIPVWDG